MKEAGIFMYEYRNNMLPLSFDGIYFHKITNQIRIMIPETKEITS